MPIRFVFPFFFFSLKKRRHVPNLMMITLFLLMGLSILAALVFSILCKQLLSNVILFLDLRIITFKNLQNKIYFQISLFFSIFNHRILTFSFSDITYRPTKLCETENCVRIGKRLINVSVIFYLCDHVLLEKIWWNFRCPSCQFERIYGHVRRSLRRFL